MLCWSCGKELPEDAKQCKHCEAPVEPEPTPEEMEMVNELLSDMGPEVLDELRAAFEGSSTGEEFVNRIMVGDCPKCDTSDTGDCGDDPEIDDICVGRCFACGQLWCLDCGQLLKKDSPACPRCSDIDDV